MHSLLNQLEQRNHRKHTDFLVLFSIRKSPSETGIKRIAGIQRNVSIPTLALTKPESIAARFSPSAGVTAPMTIPKAIAPVPLDKIIPKNSNRESVSHLLLSADTLLLIFHSILQSC